MAAPPYHCRKKPHRLSAGSFHRDATLTASHVAPRVAAPRRRRVDVDGARSGVVTAPASTVTKAARAARRRRLVAWART